MNFTYFFLLCDMGMESLNSASLLLDGAPLDNPSLGGPRLIKGNPHIFKLSGLCHLFQGMRCDDFIHHVRSVPLTVATPLPTFSVPVSQRYIIGSQANQVIKRPSAEWKRTCVSRGSQGLRSPLESRRGSLGAP